MTPFAAVVLASVPSLAVGLAGGLVARPLLGWLVEGLGRVRNSTMARDAPRERRVEPNSSR